MHTVTGDQLNTFWCLPVRREGSPVPRWLQSQAKWHFGELDVQEELDATLRRHILVARFHSEGRTRELLQPLRDAKLLQLERERMVLCGFERDLLTVKDVAQTWLLLPPGTCPNGAGYKFEASAAAQAASPTLTTTSPTR